MTGEHPLVAVGNAATDEPALMTEILQLVPPAERGLDAISIELTTEGMDAKEGAVEPVAEPIAVLGIDNPVLKELLVVAMSKLPRVLAIEHLQGVLLTCSYLQTEIRRSGRIIQQISLQSDLLSIDALNPTS